MRKYSRSFPVRENPGSGFVLPGEQRSTSTTQQRWDYSGGNVYSRRRFTSFVSPLPSPICADGGHTHAGVTHSFAPLPRVDSSRRCVSARRKNNNPTSFSVPIAASSSNARGAVTLALSFSRPLYRALLLSSFGAGKGTNGGKKRKKKKERKETEIKPAPH